MSASPDVLSTLGYVLCTCVECILGLGLVYASRGRVYGGLGLGGNRPRSCLRWARCCLRPQGCCLHWAMFLRFQKSCGLGLVDCSRDRLYVGPSLVFFCVPKSVLLWVKSCLFVSEVCSTGANSCPLFREPCLRLG